MAMAKKRINEDRSGRPILNALLPSFHNATRRSLFLYKNIYSTINRYCAPSGRAYATLLLSVNACIAGLRGLVDGRDNRNDSNWTKNPTPITGKRERLLRVTGCSITIEKERTFRLSSTYILLFTFLSRVFDIIMLFGAQRGVVCCELCSSANIAGEREVSCEERSE